MTLLVWYQDDDELQYEKFTPVAPFDVHITWEIAKENKASSATHTVVGYCPNGENSAPEMVLMTEEGKLIPITDFLYMEVGDLLGYGSGKDPVNWLGYVSVKVLK